MTDDDVLMTTRETCRFLSVDVATLYRGIRAGRFPKPIKITSHRNRWSRNECQRAIDKLKQERP
jgi:predicted DNA-binding transcriptional regulator AlpA